MGIPEITGKGRWFELDTNRGTVYIPYKEYPHYEAHLNFNPLLNKAISEDDAVDYWHEYHDRDIAERKGKETWEKIHNLLIDVADCSKIYTISLIEGHGARVNNLDGIEHTEWNVFDTMEECYKFLREFYEIGTAFADNNVAAEGKQDSS